MNKAFRNLMLMKEVKVMGSSFDSRTQELMEYSALKSKDFDMPKEFANTVRQSKQVNT